MADTGPYEFCPRCGRQTFDRPNDKCTSNDTPPCDYNDLKAQTEKSR